MSRLTIEIPDELHQHIKALAALNGQNIREFVLERIAPESAANPKKPSKRLLRALEDVKKGRLKTYNSTEELFAAWRKEDRR